MRRRITLYIGDRRADLDDQSFILFNYSFEELGNPTIVKNSFSQQIILKGTPNNNAIFGDIFRHDRVTQYSGSKETGIYFDPTRKTTFAIYNELGEILESGYLKLDKVTQTRKRAEYTCTLFGGLGSFLFGLSYDANGEELSLADLDFGETLDFNIDRSAVGDAWARIGGDTSKAAKWDIINFMPAYNGLPPSPFDANKCLVVPYASGLQSRDGDYYAGLSIVTLNDKVTGNEAKDYRSYLQKPVIKLSAVINAICDPLNNGGWTVNLDSDFFNNINPYWDATWLTLPSLYDLNITETESSSSQTMTMEGTILPIVGGGGTGMYSVTVNLVLGADMSGLPSSNFKMWCRGVQGVVINYIVATITLFDSSNNELNSATYGITTSGVTVPDRFPQPDFTFDHIDSTGAFVDSNGDPVTFPLFAEAQGASYYRVDLQSGTENYYWGSAGYNPTGTEDRMWEVGESTYTNSYGFNPSVPDNVCTVDVKSTSSSVRTGALITKSHLLKGSKTPAQYLLSLCKTFGMQMVCDKGAKVIDVILRKNFFNNSVKDINERIDRGREISKIPFSFDSRWYLFGNDAVGEYANEYKLRYNRPFGQFRVDTGYSFNADKKNLTEDIVFKNACALMEVSPLFCDLVLDGYRNVPSVLLHGGTYLLYNGSESKSVDIPVFNNAVKTWMNASYPMHDSWEKVQFHGEENKHINERDTLVFFNEMVDTSSMHLSLTDDTEEMLAMNANKPCWLPNCCDVLDPSTKINEIPKFSRYAWSGSTINLSLDFGDPLEYQIPGALLGSYSCLFDNYWRKYITDRYDDDSAVVTCWVDWRGSQVNESLFKDFYFFDGCVWALNRIINHSLTTWDLVQCEFVRVQDTTNYTTL